MNTESPRIIYVQQPAPQGNTLGTAGLILAIISLFFGWVPFVGWILWFLAALAPEFRKNRPEEAKKEAKRA